jgi:hypothetical protein
MSTESNATITSQSDPATPDDIHHPEDTIVLDTVEAVRELAESALLDNIGRHGELWTTEADGETVVLTVLLRPGEFAACAVAQFPVPVLLELGYDDVVQTVRARNEGDAELIRLRLRGAEEVV